ncbi:NRDE family protein [Dyadobacter aurulentus]|uniref:NRDE family protein n=1 Tax=Dyadobacter sp. UC 10 TaxID=2605428 RepID=UPI0011F1EC38|nr:NRDE family protein [Dyadobacter sp. UC 10]KAA0989633.1 NRDE family protein [Dyadobacter sp. UC 10]
MCTVTYVAKGDKIILTSNRDEHRDRPASLAPAPYLIGNKKITFPKDPKAGGTWFATDDFGNVAVLLNGAAVAHSPSAFHRKSRGLVLLDIISDLSPVTAWQYADLQDIEPFTIVLVQQKALFQLRWDGQRKETVPLPAAGDYIWSSSTLYTPAVQMERARWFENFLEENPAANVEELKHFHSQTANDDTENGLVIRRSNGMRTFSITQAVIENNKSELYHCDLSKEQKLSNSFISV